MYHVIFSVLFTVYVYCYYHTMIIIIILVYFGDVDVYGVDVHEDQPLLSEASAVPAMSGVSLVIHGGLGCAMQSASK